MAKSITLVMDKFPYLKHFKNKIQLREKIIEVNNNIKAELPRKIAEAKDLYDKYRFQKELLALDMEQSKNYKQLSDDQNFFKTFREKMKEGIVKTNANYDKLIAKANKSKDDKVKEKITQYASFDFKNNWEAKVSFYLELEQLLDKK